MKILKLAFLFVFASSTILVGQNVERKFVSAEMNSHGDVTITVSDGVYTIRSYNDKIVETTFIPNGEVYSPYSHAVVLNPNLIPQFIDSKNSCLYR